jgi:hypothetical protein
MLNRQSPPPPLDLNPIASLQYTHSNDYVLPTQIHMKKFSEFFSHCMGRSCSPGHYDTKPSIVKRYFKYPRLKYKQIQIGSSIGAKWVTCYRKFCSWQKMADFAELHWRLSSKISNYANFFIVYSCRKFVLFDICNSIYLFQFLYNFRA